MLYGLRKSDPTKIWGINDKGELFDDDENDRLGGIPLEVWRNPESKWLDPANGIGNFPFIAFLMLDYQLSNHWEGGADAKTRKKHIIEKMLYMVEIDKGNVNTSHKIFNILSSDAKPNICCTDTLKLTKDDLKREFSIDSFDIIIGNPPFQAPQDAEGKRGGGDELYMKFVKKSLYFLNDNGYLVFVHPPSWRKPEFNGGRKKSKNAGMFDLMAHQNQIEYIEIHDSKDGIKTFKAATRYDFYILKKTAALHSTIVKDMTGNITDVNMLEFEFLPNLNIKNVKKLFPQSDDESCDLGSCILYEASAYETRKKWVSSEEKDLFIYPLVHSTTKNGTRFFYSNTNDKGFFGIPKIIFGESGINEPVLDLEGKYGMTQGAMALSIKDKADGEKLKIFLKSNFFTNIRTACSWGGFRIDWRLFTYFKKGFWNVNVNLNEPLIGLKDYTESTETIGGKYKVKSKTRSNKRRSRRNRRNK